jgi:hypothetical protein
MDIKTALDQVDEIHRHLARTELFRGYKATVVASAGIAAFIISLVQTLNLNNLTGFEIIIQWLITASVIFTLLVINMIHKYFYRDSGFDRQLTVRVFSQFMPGLAGGLLVTLAILYLKLDISIIPGLWALFFGTAVYSMRPYLPKTIALVTFYYLIAGCMLIALAPSKMSLHPWAIGITFGLGHLFAAFIFYTELEAGNEKK